MQLSKQWDSTISLDEMLEQALFYILVSGARRSRKAVQIVHRYRLAKVDPSFRIYDTYDLSHDGEGVTYEGDSATGSTFLMREIGAGHAELTLEWSAAEHHLTNLPR